MKYQVQLNQAGQVTIVDQETKKSISAKLVIYHRIKDGKRIQHAQINFDASKLGCENKGVVQVKEWTKSDKGYYFFDCDLSSKKNESSLSTQAYLNSLFK